MKQKRILLLFAHPSQHRSEVNAELFNAAKNLDYVTAIDLYAEYPRFNIDISKEQQRLIEHDIIVFQFPFYWYSTPSILKEWQDLVLEYGFAYGPDGEYLKDKQFICAVSAGGQEQAYCASGYNHFTIRELLQPLEQTAYLTQMKYIPPFTIFASRSAKDEGRLDAHINNWLTLLKGLATGQVSADKFSTEVKVNSKLQQITMTKG